MQLWPLRPSLPRSLAIARSARTSPFAFAWPEAPRARRTDERFRYPHPSNAILAPGQWRYERPTSPGIFQLMAAQLMVWHIWHIWGHIGWRPIYGVSTPGAGPRYPQVPGTLRKLLVPPHPACTYHLKVYGTLKLSKFQELKDCSVERKSVPKQRDSL